MIATDAAAAVWGMDDENAAQQRLFELTDLALLTEIEATTSVTTFRQHGLLQVYARALLETASELLQISRKHAQYYTELSWQVSTKTPGNRTLLDHICQTS